MKFYWINHAEWWRGLPTGMKWVNLLVGLPSFLFVAYCTFSSLDNTPPFFIGLGVFAVSCVLNAIFDRRNHPTHLLKTNGKQDKDTETKGAAK